MLLYQRVHWLHPKFTPPLLVKVTPNPSRFVDHRSQVYGEEFEGMYPSVGACDEFIRLFLFRRRMRQEEILSLEGRLGDSGDSLW